MYLDPDIVFSMLLIAGLYVLLAESLNIINGFTGMFSLGHVAFYGIGAYAAAFYMNAFAPDLYSAAYWLHFAVGLLVAMLAAAIAGIAIGVPCLRLAGDYLAIATLAFAEIFKIILESSEVLGGSIGVRLARNTGKMDSHWAFCIVLFAIAGITLFIRNLKRSATGRAFLAIRENEIAARVMGMNIAFLKVEAFVIGAAIAGLAGGVFAYSNYSIAPSNFDIMLTIMVLLMIVLGGQGSITGSIIGAVILAMVDPLVRYLPEMINWTFIQPLLSGLKQNPQIFYAFLLVLIIRVRPSGIMGAHEWTWYLPKNRRQRSREAGETSS